MCTSRSCRVCENNVTIIQINIVRHQTWWGKGIQYNIKSNSELQKNCVTSGTKETCTGNHTLAVDPMNITLYFII